MSRTARLPRFARRLWNRVRRLASGLGLEGENISPETPNDLYQAHLSIYGFFSRFVRGRNVLDLGCGCGYGAPRLIEGGAASVLGVDIDPRNVRYANRRFGSPRVTFRRADVERLPPDLGLFEVVVSSNLLEHLTDVDAALSGALRLSGPKSAFLMAVPPIFDDWSRREHAKIPFHRTNLSVGEWGERLRRRWTRVREFRHLEPPGARPDFGDPFPSRLAAGDFRFVEVAPGELETAPTITAIFLAEEPLPSGPGDSLARPRSVP